MRARSRRTLLRSSAQAIRLADRRWVRLADLNPSPHRRSWIRLADPEGIRLAGFRGIRLADRCPVS